MLLGVCGCEIDICVCLGFVELSFDDDDSIFGDD